MSASYFAFFAQLNVNIIVVRHIPRYARTTRFDQGTKRVMCTTDMSTEVLDTIHGWFREKSTVTEGTLRTQGNLRRQIFWLMARQGLENRRPFRRSRKNYHKTEGLGASFFCSKGNIECSNVNMVFPTIAYQLCLFHPIL